MNSLDFFATHPVFTYDEFVSARQGSGSTHRGTVTNVLRGHVSAGRILRIMRGLYASVPPAVASTEFVPDPYLLACKLAPDAVVSFHSALQYRGHVYSLWNRYQYSTCYRRHRFSFRGAEFVPVLRSSLTDSPETDEGRGCLLERHAGGVVRVATFERTLVDLLDTPRHGGGWEESWRSLEMVEFFDLDAVVRHALEAASSLTVARVGFYLEQHRESLMVEEDLLERLRGHVPANPSYMDRQRRSGRLVKRWNLVVPHDLLDRHWDEVL